MIRTFDLMNSAGETYNLTVAHRYTGFLAQADGLGFESVTEYQRFGDEYEPVNDYFNQSVISGTIQFFQPYAYRKYAAFAQFCQDKSLTMYYRTPAGMFKRDGSITKVEKSEGSDCLKVKVEFTTKGLWYKELHVTSSSNSITVVSDSKIESPCELRFKPSSNIMSAHWTQSVNGTSVLTGAVSGVLVSDVQVLSIRTDTNPYKIYVGNVDCYRYSNFSTKRFVKIQYGSNVIDFDKSGSIGVTARILYETV